MVDLINPLHCSELNTPKLAPGPMALDFVREKGHKSVSGACGNTARLLKLNTFKALAYNEV